MNLEGVLFDLDGTLVDTAPDLVAVLNRLLVEEDCAPMPYAIARNEVSNGAVGLLRLGFADLRSPEDFALLRERFLQLYERDICVNSKLFIDIDSVFRESPAMRWGIVTNKPGALTQRLLEQLGIADRWGTVVSGDRLPERKPDPAPLRLAAHELGVAPAQCVYIGDAPRDIEAGRAAGMATIVAAFGYIRPRENPAAWGADLVLRRPRDLHRVLGELRTRSAA